MNDILRHRGPDDAATWHEESIGLAHCALHTTPEATAEHQPHVVDGGVLVLAADARIDNREELIRILELPRTSEVVVTDADIILAAYRKWKSDCAEHLVGAFALALWDGRERHLFCARDHAGIKPFYYSMTPGRFVFASEIKALFRTPGVQKRINEERIAAHLTTIFPRDPTMTWFEGIVRMPPAHVLTVSEEDVTLRRYWSLDPHRELRLPSDEAYTQAFREHFTEAVRCRLRSITPVGSTLSGGMDSSSIACVARDLLQESRKGPLHTFSAIFPSLPEELLKPLDERTYMQAVHDMGGFEEHFFHADEHSPLWPFEKAAWHMDEAIWAPNLYLHWGMYGLAQKQGVRVFLDGIDGDSVVSHGVEYLTELYYTREWDVLEAHIRALAENNGRSPAWYARGKLYSSITEQVESSQWLRAVGAMYELHQRLGIPWRELVGVHVLPNILPEGLSIWLSRQRGREEASSRLLNPGFAEQIGQGDGPHGFTDVVPDTYHIARQGHIDGLSDALFGPLFEITDKASAAFNVESRFPFFDRRLIEFCVSLPAAQKLHAGWTRMILRRAMEGLLPRSIQWRKDKAHLGGNFVRNMWRFEQDTLEEIVHDTDSTHIPYIDHATVMNIYERAQSQANEHKRGNDTRDLYTVLMLKKWLLQNKNGS